jgi:hypothetical protein
MRIQTLEFDGRHLMVKCSGPFGVGSAGHSSAVLLREAIEEWLRCSVHVPVDELVVDFTDVDYEWGDGPVTSTLPLIAKRLVARVRFVANANNRRSLQSLVDASGLQTAGLPWFVVQGTNV